MSETFLNGRVVLHAGDSRDVLKTIPDCSIDSIVCDPPYALVSIVKRFGGKNAATVKVPETGSGAYARASSGFMNKTWDTGETAFATDFWAECLRVLKPGGHVVAFSGTRTYHRMACAIEDAGFEIRDSLMWVYATGFPKSHNMDNHRGGLICGCGDDAMHDVSETRTSSTVTNQTTEGDLLQLQLPQQDLCRSLPIDSTQGPRRMDGGIERGLASPLHGTDQSRMEGRSLLSGAQGQLRVDEVCSMSAGSVADGSQGRLRDGTPLGHVPPLPLPPDADGMRAPHGSQPEKQRADELGIVAGQPLAQDGRAWPNCRRCGKPMVTRGLGSALKPAFEPIVLARKPLSEGTVAANCLKWGTGALNIGACRVSHNEPVKTTSRDGKMWLGVMNNTNTVASAAPEGRWPANVVTDGSDEVVGMFPSPHGAGKSRTAAEGTSSGVKSEGWGNMGGPAMRFGDSGSAARFFYSAKADADDRLGSKHPTVKPVDLMQWLCRLVTPKGGTVLDPFAGTGTTGEAAFREGFNAVLIEREEEYQADIRRRMGLVLSGPDERSRESIKARTAGQPIDAGPLFAGSETPPAWEGKSTESSRTNHRADGTEMVNE